MKRLRRFLHLPAAERQLLVKAALLLRAIRLGMRLLPFRTLRYLLTGAAGIPRRSRHADHPSAKTIAWAVEAANHCPPGVKTCLAQALATQVLLARCGYRAVLYLGVAKGAQEEFQAHAWVESDGKVVSGGGSKLGRYTPLAVLEVEGRP
jgi:hypothetical protein